VGPSFNIRRFKDRLTWILLHEDRLDNLGFEVTTMQPIFETSRLIAREMTLEDLDFVAHLMGDPEVMRCYPRCLTREEAREAILEQRRNYSTHGYGRWLIEDRAGGRPLGLVGVLPRRVEGLEEPEVACMIDRPCWRRGYASEAAAASRDHAFRKLEAPRVIALVRPVNVGSRGVARRIGMRPGRLIIHAGHDHDINSMDREQWTEIDRPPDPA
jgi:RimJ/RimL family protein N-acetyltransferase